MGWEGCGRRRFLPLFASCVREGGVGSGGGCGGGGGWGSSECGVDDANKTVEQKWTADTEGRGRNDGHAFSFLLFFVLLGSCLLALHFCRFLSEAAVFFFSICKDSTPCPESLTLLTRVHSFTLCFFRAFNPLSAFCCFFFVFFPRTIHRFIVRGCHASRRSAQPACTRNASEGARFLGFDPLTRAQSAGTLHLARRQQRWGGEGRRGGGGDV